jgi:hypothetical protein
VSDTSSFKDGLAMLREEEVFAKAAPFGGPFAKCVADLRHYLDTGVIPGEPGSDGWAQNLMDRARGSSRTFTKALSDLDAMTKAAKKPARVVSVEARDPAGDAAAVITKSFAALNHDASLNADQRGRLMLGLSSLAGKMFAKSDRAPITLPSASVPLR